MKHSNNIDTIVEYSKKSKIVNPLSLEALNQNISINKYKGKNGFKDKNIRSSSSESYYERTNNNKSTSNILQLHPVKKETYTLVNVKNKSPILTNFQINNIQNSNKKMLNTLVNNKAKLNFIENKYSTVNQFNNDKSRISSNIPYKKLSQFILNNKPNRKQNNKNLKNNFFISNENSSNSQLNNYLSQFKTSNPNIKYDPSNINKELASTESYSLLPNKRTKFALDSTIEKSLSFEIINKTILISDNNKCSFSNKKNYQTKAIKIVKEVSYSIDKKLLKKDYKFKFLKDKIKIIFRHYRSFKQNQYIKIKNNSSTAISLINSILERNKKFILKKVFFSIFAFKSKNYQKKACQIALINLSKINHEIEKKLFIENCINKREFLNIMKHHYKSNDSFSKINLKRIKDNLYSCIINSFSINGTVNNDIINDITFEEIETHEMSINQSFITKIDNTKNHRVKTSNNQKINADEKMKQIKKITYNTNNINESVIHYDISKICKNSFYDGNSERFNLDINLNMLKEKIKYNNSYKSSLPLRNNLEKNSRKRREISKLNLVCHNNKEVCNSFVDISSNIKRKFQVIHSNVNFSLPKQINASCIDSINDKNMNNLAKIRHIKVSSFTLYNNDISGTDKNYLIQPLTKISKKFESKSNELIRLKYKQLLKYSNSPIKFNFLSTLLEQMDYCNSNIISSYNQKMIINYFNIYIKAILKLNNFSRKNKQNLKTYLKNYFNKLYYNEKLRLINTIISKCQSYNRNKNNNLKYLFYIKFKKEVYNLFFYKIKRKTYNICKDNEMKILSSSSYIKSLSRELERRIYTNRIKSYFLVWKRKVCDMKASLLNLLNKSTLISYLDNLFECEYLNLKKVCFTRINEKFIINRYCSYLLTKNKYKNVMNENFIITQSELSFNKATEKKEDYEFSNYFSIRKQICFLILLSKVIRNNTLLKIIYAFSLIKKYKKPKNSLFISNNDLFYMGFNKKDNNHTTIYTEAFSLIFKVRKESKTKNDFNIIKHKNDEYELSHFYTQIISINKSIQKIFLANISNTISFTIRSLINTDILNIEKSKDYIIRKLFKEDDLIKQSNNYFDIPKENTKIITYRIYKQNPNPNSLYIKYNKLINNDMKLKTSVKKITNLFFINKTQKRMTLRISKLKSIINRKKRNQLKYNCIPLLMKWKKLIIMQYLKFAVNIIEIFYIEKNRKLKLQVNNILHSSLKKLFKDYIFYCNLKPFLKEFTCGYKICQFDYYLSRVVYRIVVKKLSNHNVKN